MDAGAALSALEKAGTEQNRKTYRRHGYPEPMYGVSFAFLRGMAKDIGADQSLAEELWATANTDARLLAAMIADPEALTRDVADRWVAEARCHTLVDEVARVVARSPLALPCMSAWVASDDEWIGRGGWSVMAVLANEHPEVPDASFTPYLAVIERRIGGAMNRAREAMNTALIAIGGRSDPLAAAAVPVATRIGQVEIDHGDTACETPAAVPYIEKMRARAHGKNGKSPKGSKGAKAAKAVARAVKSAAAKKTVAKVKAPAATATPKKKAAPAKAKKKAAPAPAPAKKKKPAKRR